MILMLKIIKMKELSDKASDDPSFRDMTGNDVRVSCEKNKYEGEPNFWQENHKLMLTEICGSYFFIPRDLKITLEKDPSQISTEDVERHVFNYLLTKKIAVLLYETFGFRDDNFEYDLWRESFELVEQFNSGAEDGKNLVSLFGDSVLKGKVELSVAKIAYLQDEKYFVKLASKP